VGDSFTFGSGIERAEDTWPRVLERSLAEYGSFEVYNVSMPGTSTAYQRRMLRTPGGYDLDPDEIVLGFVLNDPESPDEVLSRLNPPLLPQPGLDRALTRRSYAYAWLRGRKNALMERLGWKETYFDHIHALYHPESLLWQHFEQQARGLAADAEARGILLTVAIFPMFYHLEDYPFVEEHRQAAEVFREAGARVIDLLDVFVEAPTRGLHLAPDDAHPNERAHRIAGEAIAERLAARISPAERPPQSR
jgi:hypothetical protein